MSHKKNTRHTPKGSGNHLQKINTKPVFAMRKVESMDRAHMRKIREDYKENSIPQSRNVSSHVPGSHSNYTES
ncbi:MAG: hypothetical protein ACOCXT_01925 [Candidatus Dojkabacteria bacterium]